MDLERPPMSLVGDASFRELRLHFRPFICVPVVHFEVCMLLPQIRHVIKILYKRTDSSFSIVKPAPEPKSCCHMTLVHLLILYNTR
jgi:hypothetical protein